MITIAGVYLPDTMGTRMLAVLYLAPHHPLPVADMLGVTPAAARKRLERAADSIGRFAPRLAVELRNHLRWTNGVATYKPSGRYVSVRNASPAL
ncbi:hypothetical protein VSR69_42565 [Paraburkholderia phytofirmans]|uniref:hypothetical protein n=1 Tax=Paraburkholderia sp. BL9I2N2 TaxID=1938809 RepID=UPI0010485EA2|nr:hypothetical protein [Paraburkholderia sp. BL9I2N2]TCK94131.1 hypothetical protein B0G74_0667 [Paraburkholderia sp. BL9I2N2]